MAQRRVVQIAAGAALVTAAAGAVFVTEPAAETRSMTVAANVTDRALTEPLDVEAVLGLKTAAQLPEPTEPVYLTELDIPDGVSIAVLNPNTGDQIQVGDGDYTSASLVKVAIAAAVLVEADGQISSNQQRLINAAITYSDNDSTTTLFRQIGLADGLTPYLEQFGLVETTVGPGSEWGSTMTTAADQLTLLQAIFGPNRLLNDQASEYLSDVMTNVVDYHRIGVTAGSPTPETAALKPGFVQSRETGEWTVSSIGRIDIADGGELLIAVLSDGHPSMEAGVAAIESAVVEAVNALS